MIDVKICGIKTKSVRDAAIKEGADYLGFMFYAQSPRYIDLITAKNLRAGLPSSVRAVAVVADAENMRLDEIMEHVQPDMIQAHGHESPARIANMKARYRRPIIKSIPVASIEDVDLADSYEHADMILFDAKPDSASCVLGGSGRSFDWHVLSAVRPRLPRAWMLAGGLNMQNVSEAVRISGASCVDVSSCVESQPGEKDPDLVARFLRRVKAL